MNDLVFYNVYCAGFDFYRAGNWFQIEQSANCELRSVSLPIMISLWSRFVCIETFLVTSTPPIDLSPGHSSLKYAVWVDSCNIAIDLAPQAKIKAENSSSCLAVFFSQKQIAICSCKCRYWKFHTRGFIWSTPSEHRTHSILSNATRKEPDSGKRELF